jgi:opacity protein-like surface antigen
MQSQVRRFLLGAAILCAVVKAYAADNNFTGAAIGANFAYRHDKVEFGGFLNGTSTTHNDVSGQLDLSYGIPVSNAWVTTLGATYDLNNSDFGSLTYDAGSQNSVVNYKLKEHWSIYFAPGYRVAPDWLVYGKVAYHHAKGEYTDSLFGNGNTTHDGFGYGVGVSYAAIRNIQLGFEIQRIDLSSGAGNLSTGKPSMTEAVFKAAYRF